MTKYWLYAIVIILLTACEHHINPDPSIGAQDFCKELESYTKDDNYQDANERLSAYLAAYSRQDQFVFIITLNQELQKSVYHSVKRFVDQANGNKHSSFAQLKELSIEIVMVKPKEAATLFCDKMAGFAEKGDYVQANEYVSEFLSVGEKAGNLSVFYHALASELTQEYNRIVKRFIYQVDSRRFQVLFELKCHLIAAEEIMDIYVRHVMSVKALSIPRKQRSQTSSQGSMYPDDEEVEFFNSNCPLEIDRSLVLSRVLFDEKKMEYLFVYNYTQPVDNISPKGINIAKSAIRHALEDEWDVAKRIRAGLTHIYIFRSDEDRKLYEIKIDNNDLKSTIDQL